MLARACFFTYLQSPFRDDLSRLQVVTDCQVYFGFLVNFREIRALLKVIGYNSLVMNFNLCFVCRAQSWLGQERLIMRRLVCSIEAVLAQIGSLYFAI